MVQRYRGVLRAAAPPFVALKSRINSRARLGTPATFASAACARGSVARPPPSFRRKAWPPRTAPISTTGTAGHRVQDSVAAEATVRDDSAGTSYWPGSSRSSASAFRFLGGIGRSGRADDEAIRTAFDQPASMAASTSRHGQPTGLFLHPRLTSPNALASITQQTLLHAHHLVDRIASITPSFTPSFPSSPFSSATASPFEQSRRIRMVPKLLDRLSDTICLVIDMCELIRNVHPSEEWVRQADNSYEVLGSFMNGLNTHTGLYEALRICSETPHEPPLNPSEVQLLETFQRDFEKSGIHLPSATRKTFVELSDEIQILGRQFLGDIAATTMAGEEAVSSADMIEIPDASTLLVGMGSQFVDALPRGARGSSKTSRFVAPQSWAAQMILRHARNPEARRIVYMGSNACSEERVEVLEALLQRRGQLANLLGRECWSEVVLGDKMAKTPDNVMGFLTSLARHQRPAAAADLALLATQKRHEEPKGMNATGQPLIINAWDKEYFSERHLQSLSPSRMQHPLYPYFSAGTILQGLSRLFTRLYGLSFEPVDLRPGEAWHPDVRKLNVVDEQEGVIGVIYCDLFSRQGKPPSAAHYTVRCSRRIDNDDPEGDLLPPSWDWSRGMTGVEDFEGVRVAGKEGRYQLPIVVLTTDFQRPSVEDGPSCLVWQEVETLFHEMGHAIHSMLGRTEYHNVSGTRCATDFVELPSILMEQFVASPAVLPLFARHHATDAVLPLEHFKAHLALQSRLSALETHGQIMMATLDQVYHSSAVQASSRFDSTAAYHDLQASIGIIPPVPGTAWQTQFGHLVGYGATYYSYLFDRAIAGKVWASLFADDPLSRQGGEALRDQVLKWGGGRDPWEMVANVLQDDSLVKGDSEAMRKVGGWLLKQ